MVCNLAMAQLFESSKNSIVSFFSQCFTLFVIGRWKTSSSNWRRGMTGTHFLFDVMLLILPWRLGRCVGAESTINQQGSEYHGRKRSVGLFCGLRTIHSCWRNRSVDERVDSDERYKYDLRWKGMDIESFLKNWRILFSVFEVLVYLLISQINLCSLSFYRTLSVDSFSQVLDTAQLTQQTSSSSKLTLNSSKWRKHF